MTSGTSIAPPPPPERQAISPNQKKEGVVTAPISQVEKYQLAYMDVWSKLPKWKQIAIDDERKKNVTDGRLMDEFLKEVTRLAELE